MKWIKHLCIPFFAIFTLLFSLSPWLINLLSTPRKQIFSGIHWWDPDYFVYLSYVENGVRGYLQERFLINTLTHYTAWIHGIYTISGYLLGHVIGLNSIFIYHIDRLVLGLLFILLLSYLYLSIFKSQFWTFIALFFVFWIPGFPKLNMDSLFFSRYLSWLQQLNILTRASGLPHYLFGFMFFIPAIWIYLVYRGSSVKKIVFLIFLTNCFTIANPVNALIFYTTVAMYLILRFFIKLLRKIVKPETNFPLLYPSYSGLQPEGAAKRIRGVYAGTNLSCFSINLNTLFQSGITRDFLTAMAVFIFNLPLIWYYYTLLSKYPWGTISNVFKFFVGNAKIPTNEVILAIGPSVFFSLIGILFFMWKIMTTEKEQNKWYLFCISWILVQGTLYVYANKLGIEKYRFIQGLYYIPMGVLTVGGLQFIGRILGKSVRHWAVILTIISFVVTLPTLYYSYMQNLYTFTDLKYFQTYFFPTVKQYEAYKYLEHTTPFASTVLAGLEASAHIPALSGNANKLDHIDRGEVEKSQFFSNNLEREKAYSYLKKNNISYVWVGWEERNMGFNIQNYPYLQSIFRNDDVEIYKVL